MKYPVNGPREPVYALMRELGFSMSNWSDKVWSRPDGVEITIYGAGSMARTPWGECNMDDLASKLGNQVK